MADDASVYCWEHDPESNPRALILGERNALRRVLDRAACECEDDHFPACADLTVIHGHLDETEAAALCVAAVEAREREERRR